VSARDADTSGNASALKCGITARTPSSKVWIPKVVRLPANGRLPGEGAARRGRLVSGVMTGAVGRCAARDQSSEGGVFGTSAASSTPAPGTLPATTRSGRLSGRVTSAVQESSRMVRANHWRTSRARDGGLSGSASSKQRSTLLRFCSRCFGSARRLLPACYGSAEPDAVRVLCVRSVQPHRRIIDPAPTLAGKARRSEATHEACCNAVRGPLPPPRRRARGRVHPAGARRAHRPRLRR